MQNHDDSLNQKFYRVKVTDYDHSGELSFWYDEPLGREMRRESQLYPKPRKRKTEEEKALMLPEEIQENIDRSSRRAKSKARKLAMTLQVDRILTLTYRENITDIDTSSKYFVRFIKLVHKYYPNFKYVAVAEKQKRGAWHYHIAVTGWQDVGFLRKTWRSLVDGNIDVTSPRTKGDKAQACCMVVGYITKYMKKLIDENHELGKYRYRASNGIKLKQASFWIKSQDWQAAIKDAGNLVSDLYGQIGNFYFSEDWNNGWLCSWSSNSFSRNKRQQIATTS